MHLEITNVKCFANRRDISFKSGRATLISGASGSGKSTVFQCIRAAIWGQRALQANYARKTAGKSSIVMKDDKTGVLITRTWRPSTIKVEYNDGRVYSGNDAEAQLKEIYGACESSDHNSAITRAAEVEASDRWLKIIDEEIKETKRRATEADKEVSVAKGILDNAVDPEPNAVHPGDRPVFEQKELDATSTQLNVAKRDLHQAEARSQDCHNKLKNLYANCSGHGCANNGSVYGIHSDFAKLGEVRQRTEELYDRLVSLRAEYGNIKRDIGSCKSKLEILNSSNAKTRVPPPASLSDAELSAMEARHVKAAAELQQHTAILRELASRLEAGRRFMSRESVDNVELMGQSLESIGEEISQLEKELYKYSKSPVKRHRVATLTDAVRDVLNTLEEDTSAPLMPRERRVCANELRRALNGGNNDEELERMTKINAIHAKLAVLNKLREQCAKRQEMEELEKRHVEVSKDTAVLAEAERIIERELHKEREAVKATREYERFMREMVSQTERLAELEARLGTTLMNMNVVNSEHDAFKQELEVLRHRFAVDAAEQECANQTLRVTEFRVLVDELSQKFERLTTLCDAVRRWSAENERWLRHVAFLERVRGYNADLKNALQLLDRVETARRIREAARTALLQARIRTMDAVLNTVNIYLARLTKKFFHGQDFNITMINNNKVCELQIVHDGREVKLNTLSSGEEARAKLAADLAVRLALGNRTAPLIIDEAVAHLDDATAMRVVSTIQELFNGQTCLFAAHQVDDGCVGDIVRLGDEF